MRDVFNQFQIPPFNGILNMSFPNLPKKKHICPAPFDDAPSKPPELLEQPEMIPTAFLNKNQAKQGMQIERLDHLGIVAGVIDDLKIVDMIDSRIAPHERENITCGEAVKGMILNGLGFSNRPLSLTPQFFENKPLPLLFREGVKAEYFNRFKLGNSLDDLQNYGYDLLFSEVALSVSEQEKIDTRFQSLDTTNFSLTGEYLSEIDSQAVQITYGHSKAHRPDLKQITLELMCSQDGGIPLFSKSWDGNASDNVIFEKRANSLIENFKQSPAPKYLIMDSKAYTKNNANTLSKLSFITRVPQTINVANSLIQQSLHFNKDWTVLDENYKYQLIELGHYSMDQRWIVIFSQHAYLKAEHTVNRAQKKRTNAISSQLFHLQAQRFETKKAAQEALEKLAQKWSYHKIKTITFTSHKKYKNRGKPSANSPYTLQWQINASVVRDEEKVEQLKKHKACFILATNIADDELTPQEVLNAYKQQACVENGFRFLKDPLFFVSSLFLKKPARVEGLLMVMTLSLLVYSVAQRRLRQELKRIQETLPNQIGIPTDTPTLRWLFQIMEGVHCVRITSQENQYLFIEGLNDIRMKIIALFGSCVAKFYQPQSLNDLPVIEEYG
jgi:transposase